MGHYVPWHTCEDQRTVLQRQFVASTSPWILGIQLKSPDLHSKYFCQLSYFAGPTVLLLLVSYEYGTLSLELIRFISSQAWLYMPLILALERQKQASMVYIENSRPARAT